MPWPEWRERWPYTVECPTCHDELTFNKTVQNGECTRFAIVVPFHDMRPTRSRCKGSNVEVSVTLEGLQERLV